jgi:hypothetical protein
MKMLLFRGHTLALLALLLVGAPLPAADATTPGAKVSEQIKIELRRFRRGTLQEFLADPDRRTSFSSAKVACVTHNSYLPDPFNGRNASKEYYFLEPKLGKYKNIKFIIEVNGTHEFGEAAVSEELPSSSPFWRALRTGRGSAKFYILRTLVVER